MHQPGTSAKNANVSTGEPTKHWVQTVRIATALAALATSVGCGADNASTPTASAPVRLDCAYGGGQGAPSTCLKPSKDAAYYVAQAEAYFDTLDTSADPNSKPTYSEFVARWEWPPWLKLTGYGKSMMNDTAALVTKHDPSTIPKRNCRAFDVQPFARCHVSFQYAGGPCAIYEEFTFDDAGEMTFLEAWTDSPALFPTSDANDVWAEGAGVHRLSTRIPGLGSATGAIDPAGEWMTQIAAQDAEVADFAARAKDFWGAWFKELGANGKNVYALGCGW